MQSFKLMRALTYSTLDLAISRQDNQPVANRFYKQNARAIALGMILPGLRYTCDKPLLHYATQVLLSQGADVLQLWADYANAEFKQLSETEQVVWVLEDARSLLQTGQLQRKYQRLVLVGKSIGTLAMAMLIAQDTALRQATTIWLTPLLNLPFVANAFEIIEAPGLVAGGTGDSAFEPAVANQLQKNDKIKTLVFEGANHSLEVPGNPIDSIKILASVTDNITELLG